MSREKPTMGKNLANILLITFSSNLQQREYVIHIQHPKNVMSNICQNDEEKSNLVDSQIWKKSMVVHFPKQSSQQQSNHRKISSNPI